MLLAGGRPTASAPSGTTSALNPGDKIALYFSQVIPVQDFPSTLVISPGGRITGRIIGQISSPDLANLIKAAGRQRA